LKVAMCQLPSAESTVLGAWGRSTGVPKPQASTTNLKYSPFKGRRDHTNAKHPYSVITYNRSCAFRIATFLLIYTKQWPNTGVNRIRVLDVSSTQTRLRSNNNGWQARVPCAQHLTTNNTNTINELATLLSRTCPFF